MLGQPAMGMQRKISQAFGFLVLFGDCLLPPVSSCQAQTMGVSRFLTVGKVIQDLMAIGTGEIG
jgi:hypothetical protein